MCHFKGLIFSKFLTKTGAESAFINFLGNLLRQQLRYPSKLHGKGRHRTTPNLSGRKGGERRCERGEVRGCSRCRLSGAGRHLWKPQPARDAEVWARHKPHVFSPGRVSAEDVFTQQSEKTRSRGRYKPRKLYL